MHPIIAQMNLTHIIHRGCEIILDEHGWHSSSMPASIRNTMRMLTPEEFRALMLKTTWSSTELQSDLKTWLTKPRDELLLLLASIFYKMQEWSEANWFDVSREQNQMPSDVINSIIEAEAIK